MWSSIQHIIRPENSTEALTLCEDDQTSLFAGGSYLVAERNPAINILIDINHLIDQHISQDENGLRVGAGCTLQQLLGRVGPLFSKAILASCPSKNIRNQRTLGGEIAQARRDSDLYILFLASAAEIFIDGSATGIPVSNWDGKGLVTQVFIPLAEPRFERVALLDSAPAYVIVAVEIDPESTRLAVGGKVSKTVLGNFSLSPQPEEVRAFLAEVREVFTDDHLGSVDYKHRLVTRLINELMVS